MYKGTGASPGIALGRALVIEHSELVIEKKTIENIDEEIQKLESAVKVSKEELTKVKEKALAELGEHEAEIFEAHLLVLEDPELIGSAISKIRDEKVNADYALNEIKEMFVAMFESMDNEYMRERAADIKDVTNRVLRHILGIKVVDLAGLDEEVVLIAHDLTPSDTATMNKNMVLGFLTDIGGRTSHTAIMARTLEIAAVVGLNDITKKVKDGDYIVFNGDTGEVIVNPDEETKAKYASLKEEFEEYRKSLELLKGQASITTDGRHVELAGNIGSPNDVEGLIKNDAEGVGLYRTEFLYMDKEDSFPTEEEQYEAYKAVLEGMNNKPIVIRTLDIGGDKELPYFEMEAEMNPFLGYRAIRLCLDRKDIFIVTKLWNDDHGYDKTIEAFNKSLNNLQVDYIDLYLIHWPNKLNAETWRAFEHLYETGKVKAIGVCNFKVEHLEELKKTAKIMPMVNQVEIHPFSTKNNIINYCKDNNIKVVAWSPISRGRVLSNDLMIDLSQKYKKSIVQIVLRWHMQKGVIPIPKSSNENRIKENIDIFDFEISSEDMKAIDSLDEGYDMSVTTPPLNTIYEEVR